MVMARASPMLQRGGGGQREQGAGGPWWVLGLFPHVQSGGALLCLSVVKPLPKAQSSNVWLYHTSQKESEQGRRRRRWLGFGVQG